VDSRLGESPVRDKIDRDCLHHTVNKYIRLGTEQLLKPEDYMRVVLGWNDKEIAKLLRWMKKDG